MPTPLVWAAQVRCPGLAGTSRTGAGSARASLIYPRGYTGIWRPPSGATPGAAPPVRRRPAARRPRWGVVAGVATTEDSGGADGPRGPTSPGTWSRCTARRAEVALSAATSGRPTCRLDGSAHDLESVKRLEGALAAVADLQREMGRAADACPGRALPGTRRPLAGRAGPARGARADVDRLPGRRHRGPRSGSRTTCSGGPPPRGPLRLSLRSAGTPRCVPFGPFVPAGSARMHPEHCRSGASRW